jgi:alpha-tubulin suppressor-like RCC1 family protein
MDISNLIIQLQAKVNNLTYNQLAVTKSIEMLKTGQVNYVNAYSELPAADTVNGYMYYVKSLGLYFSNGTTWTRMDPVEYYNSIWSWGQAGNGQLGDNSTANKSSPVLVLGGFTDWCQVSAGMKNSLAVRQNGTAWAWGQNYCGSLGDNTTVSKSSPVLVVGGFTDWCQISAGGFFANNERHSVAVRTNGTAWSWGSGTSGSLGDNTTVSKSSPVSVIGGFTDWCQVSGGPEGSLGVRTNGTAWGWGSGGSGQLGNNNTNTFSSPVSVVGGFTDWCQISIAESQGTHSLAVRQNGTAWAWGNGGDGRLGDNTTVSKSSPVSVVGGFTDWCQVSGGNRFSVGVRQNGTVWTWGYNYRGQLGINSTVDKSSPVSVIGGFTDWCQASAGVGFISAVRTNGTAWSWGQNNYGNLGNNSTSNFSSPVSVVGGFNDWCQVSVGLFHSLGLRATPDNI